MSSAATTVSVKCGKCDGKGRLSWTNVANGVCFVCDGAGTLVADESTVKAARSPRAHVIAVIHTNINQMAKTAKAYGCAFTFSDESYTLGWALAHADADVHARAIAALVRLGATEVNLFNIRRIEADEVAKLVAGVTRASDAARVARTGTGFGAAALLPRSARVLERDPHHDGPATSSAARVLRR